MTVTLLFAPTVSPPLTAPSTDQFTPTALAFGLLMMNGRAEAIVGTQGALTVNGVSGVIVAVGDGVDVGVLVGVVVGVLVGVLLAAVDVADDVDGALVALLFVLVLSLVTLSSSGAWVASLSAEVTSNV